MNLRLLGITLSVLILLSACEKAEEPPTPTPNQDSIQAASTLFAQPTHELRATPTITPSNEVELELNRTIAKMEQAILAGDMETYLTYVWAGDPLFLAEHTRWALDWQEHPLSVFEIALFGIQELTEDKAAARMVTRWSQRDYSGSGSSGGTTTSVVFFHEGDRWLLAGERWQTVETEGFTLYYFKDEIVDNQLQADAVQESLPMVFTTITRELGYVPQNGAHIKMYDSYTAMQNWTRLSIPFIVTWNEPGESIRVAVNPVNNTAPPDFDLAREYARFILYEMAGESHGNFPWWLEEGIAEYGGLQFRTLSRRNQIIQGIAELVSSPDDAEFRLFEWSEIESRPRVLGDDIQVAVNQAFTLVQFVTESYGDEARNAWIKAIATDQTLDEACASELGVTFEELDTAWRVWLIEQL